MIRRADQGQPPALRFHKTRRTRYPLGRPYHKICRTHQPCCLLPIWFMDNPSAGSVTQFAPPMRWTHLRLVTTELVEPEVGIEPTTCGLQDRDSTCYVIRVHVPRCALPAVSLFGTAVSSGPVTTHPRRYVCKPFANAAVGDAYRSRGGRDVTPSRVLLSDAMRHARHLSPIVRHSLAGEGRPTFPPACSNTFSVWRHFTG